MTEYAMSNSPARSSESSRSLPSRRNPWEPTTTHSNGQAGLNGHADTEAVDDSALLEEDEDLTRSAFRIFLYTFALSITFTLSAAATLYLVSISTPSWRVPFFLATVALFHLLEYAVTAHSNPSFATTTAFLLNNGKAYNVAHALAMLECALHIRFTSWLSLEPQPWIAMLGLGLMVMGQGVRTLGMVTAGSNFNHIVQSEKRTGHVLVTKGVYAWLRHPSYFGFFWWGLGTQLVLGNVFCLAGYAVVLWRFFRGRIESEERFLVGFFGADYVGYRRRTVVGIPFIS